MAGVRRFQVGIAFTEKTLGSAPADRKVYETFIASKKRGAEEKRRAYMERRGLEPLEPVVGTVEEEIETIREDAGLTVFHSDASEPDGKGIFVFDYTWKGFFKETAEILADDHGIKQPRSKLDNYLFVYPRRIYILGIGERPLRVADGRMERPLRAMTMQGPRVSLACSEYVEAGRTCSFEVKVYPNLKAGYGRESRAIDAGQLLETLLKYGEDKGFAQWRNGGWGRFTATTKELK